MSNSTRLALGDARGPLCDLMEKLDGSYGEKWLLSLKRFLRKENPWRDPSGFRCLSQEKQAVLSEGVTPIELAGFFIDPRLFVSDEFREKFLKVAKSPVDLPMTWIHFFDLVNGAGDDMIQKELPIGFCYEDVTEFCCILARLLRSQLKGESGVLVSNNHNNIFYVRCADEIVGVYVTWHLESRRWSIVLNLAGYSREKHSRVFSHARDVS